VIILHDGFDASRVPIRPAPIEVSRGDLLSVAAQASRNHQVIPGDPSADCLQCSIQDFSFHIADYKSWNYDAVRQLSSRETEHGDPFRCGVGAGRTDESMQAQMSLLRSRRPFD
jgi:hypothetical protein